jgi:hypothetical protein
LQVPAGDYILEVEANGYIGQWWDHASSQAAASVVSVASGEFRSIDFALTPISNPLTIGGLGTNGVFPGESQTTFVIGSGFLRGGVSGLAFTAGDGVTITVDAVLDDPVAQVTITTSATVALGARDLVGTRDDGSITTCVGCLVVQRADPVVTSVSPSVVRTGKRTIVVSGTHLQRVVKVTSSSRRVQVQSFKNKADGSIAVQVKIGGGPRRTYTLTFTRDDGTVFTADFSVGK